MRIPIFDLNLKRKDIEFNPNNAKEFFKSQASIPLLQYKQPISDLGNFDTKEQLGVITNISVYKGILRGDLIVEPEREKEVFQIVGKHLEKDRLRFAIVVDGIKQQEKLKVSAIKRIYYFYLTEKENNK